MGVLISAKAKVLGEQVWLVDMPPHQVRFFGEARQSCGNRSVIALKEPKYDEVTKCLQFDADDATTLSIGTVAETVAVGNRIGDARQISSHTANKVPAHNSFGPGDREFLALVGQLLPQDMQKTALELIRSVRQRSSGDLLRGKSRNFSNTPDNFWYVVVQPQVQHLQITVRGSVEHFAGIGNLELKDDRGNTRFKVSRSSDVIDALALIFHAKRKV